MNQEIVQMAREACKTTNWKPGLGNEHVVEFLAQFAALVRADECEACAQVCENIEEYDGFVDTYYSRCYARAIRARNKQ